MSKVTSMFASMVRAATASFRQFCYRCNAETVWRFVGEDARMEYYRCERCGDKKGLAARQ